MTTTNLYQAATRAANTLTAYDREFYLLPREYGKELCHAIGDMQQAEYQSASFAYHPHPDGPTTLMLSTHFHELQTFLSKAYRLQMVFQNILNFNDVADDELANITRQRLPEFQEAIHYMEYLRSFLHKGYLDYTHRVERATHTLHNTLNPI